MKMEQLRLIPKDLLCLIPKFEGEEGLLNLFIKKAEYIYRSFADPNNATQTLYVFHAISSRLIGRAATLLSERDDINCWNTLKDILIQHFGDPRSEDCIAIELEQMKIKSGESFIDFCHRIQHMRSTLFAKVNLIQDEGVKAAKMIVYNNMSLNVFLYNLPEDLIRIVRLRQCANLESALSVVTEEVNFMNQYNAKNKMKQNITSQNFKPQQSVNMLPNNNSSYFRYANPHFGPQNKFQLPNHDFKFGIPHQQQGQKFVAQNNFNNGSRFNNNMGPQNFKFGIPNQQSNFKFGVPQHSQGFRPSINNYARPPPTFTNQPQNNFKFGIPQHGQGFRPPINNYARPSPAFTNQPQNNFKFGIPNQNFQKQNLNENTDVSMRTARPIKQNMLDDSRVPQDNEILYNNEPEISAKYYNQNINYCDENNYTYNLEVPQHEVETYSEVPEVCSQELCQDITPNNIENFHIEASNCDKILKLPHIEIPEIQARFMVDTGSTRSFISPAKAEQYFSDSKLNEPFEVISTHARSRHNAAIHIPLFKTFKSFKKHKFYIYNLDSRYDGLIGSDLLKQLDASIDMKNQILHTQDTNIPILYNSPYEPRTEKQVKVPTDKKSHSPRNAPAHLVPADALSHVKVNVLGEDDQKSIKVNVEKDERKLGHIDNLVEGYKIGTQVRWKYHHFRKKKLME